MTSIIFLVRIIQLKALGPQPRQQESSQYCFEARKNNEKPKPW